jgi:hypothetical protein
MVYANDIVMVMKTTQRTGNIKRRTTINICEGSGGI